MVSPLSTGLLLSVRVFGLLSTAEFSKQVLFLFEAFVQDIERLVIMFSEASTLQACQRVVDCLVLAARREHQLCRGLYLGVHVC